MIMRNISILARVLCLLLIPVSGFTHSKTDIITLSNGDDVTAGEDAGTMVWLDLTDPTPTQLEAEDVWRDKVYL